jgi:hypothetical protein
VHNGEVEDLEIERMPPNEEKRYNDLGAKVEFGEIQKCDHRWIWSCLHCEQSHMPSCVFEKHCQTSYVVKYHPWRDLTRSIVIRHNIQNPVYKADFTIEDCFLPPMPGGIVALKWGQTMPPDDATVSSPKQG